MTMWPCGSAVREDFVRPTAHSSLFPPAVALRISPVQIASSSITRPSLHVVHSRVTPVVDRNSPSGPEAAALRRSQ
jgi:hypothetical protein